MPFEIPQLETYKIFLSLCGQNLLFNFEVNIAKKSKYVQYKVLGATNHLKKEGSE